MTDYHCFEQGGDHLLFFSRTARLYQLTPLAAALVPGITKGSPPATVPLPDFEEKRVHAELRAIFSHELSLPLPASHAIPHPPGGNGYQTFSIYLAQTCNMACCYCWNRGGSFGGPGRLMERSTALRVVQLILALAEKSSAEKIYVNFYGGEPLLHFPILKLIVGELLQHESQLGKKFCLTLDTNGTLLHGAAADFLACHFTHIAVSLDGGRRVHDIQRPGRRGESTWLKIVHNIRTFPDPTLLGIRATLTTFSESYLETFRQLTTLGIGRIQLEYCHRAGKRGNAPNQELIVPHERQMAELREFVDYYVDYLRRYRDTQEIPFVSNLLDETARMKRGIRSTRPCGAGSNTLAINCSGEVFPCIALVDRPEFLMGEAAATASLSLHRELAGFRVDDRFPCRACWLRYDCAGGCHAARYDQTGPTPPHPDYCHNMQGRAEVLLYALARMLATCPWHL